MEIFRKNEFRLHGYLHDCFMAALHALRVSFENEHPLKCLFQENNSICQFTHYHREIDRQNNIVVNSQP